MGLRPRNKGNEGQEDGVSKKNPFVLQEGIPTALKNTKTGANLEIVLMCADGEIFSYFAREQGIPPAAADAKQAPQNNSTDDCVSLNVGGAQFVQRDVFESSAEYQEAFAAVRKSWWKYYIIGSLSMLALAKQKKRYNDSMRQPQAPSPPASNAGKLGGKEESKQPRADAASKDVKAQQSKAEPKKVPKKAAEAKQASAAEESQTAFSRRISGHLMRSVNERRAKLEDAGNVLKEAAKRFQALLAKQPAFATSQEQRKQAESILEGFIEALDNLLLAGGTSDAFLTEVNSLVTKTETALKNIED